MGNRDKQNGHNDGQSGRWNPPNKTVVGRTVGSLFDNKRENQQQKDYKGGHTSGTKNKR